MRSLIAALLAISTTLKEGIGIGLLAAFPAIDDLRKGALVRVVPRYHTDRRNAYIAEPGISVEQI
jgi:DNA-binding transcriptional LysR family regulator